MLSKVFLALLLLPACSSGDDGGMVGFGGSTTFGSGGTAGATAGNGGTPVSGGSVGLGDGGAGAGTAGGGTNGGGAGAAQGGGGATAATGGAGGSDSASQGGAPQVTPSMATSIPSMYGNPVANPGTFTLRVMYPVSYYSTTTTREEAFEPTPTIPPQTPIMKPLNVYTPPGYDPQTEYPLIIIMHGITDNENTWNERSNPKVATLFDNLITSKTTKPFIAVFAWGTSVERNNTAGYYAFGGELTNDLLPFLEANYSVKKDRGSRAMAGFSFGGMQTVNIGLCAHLKEFAWFAGLDAAGGVADATEIASYVEMQNPLMYPLYYFYLAAGRNDGGAISALMASSDGLTSKGPYVTTANFSAQADIVGPGDGGHVYPTAEVGLYNFLRMAFAPN